MLRSFDASEYFGQESLVVDKGKREIILSGKYRYQSSVLPEQDEQKRREIICKFLYSGMNMNENKKLSDNTLLNKLDTMAIKYSKIRGVLLGFVTKTAQTKSYDLTVIESYWLEDEITSLVKEFNRRRGIIASINPDCAPIALLKTKRIKQKTRTHSYNKSQTPKPRGAHHAKNRNNNI